jgi:hypothetical protein
MINCELYLKKKKKKKKEYNTLKLCMLKPTHSFGQKKFVLSKINSLVTTYKKKLPRNYFIDVVDVDFESEFNE